LGGDNDMYYVDPDLPFGYETWVQVRRMPKLNWGSPELRRRMFDGPDAVVRRWLRAGLDGWRLDVANSTGRRIADAFTHQALRELRAAMTAEKPDSLLVGEHAHDWTGDADTGGWQATMNYGGFTKPVWSWLATEPSEFLGVPTGIPRLPATAMVAAMRTFGARASWGTRTRSWSLLDSHDTPRFRTLVGGDPALVEVGVGLMATLPGTPMLFAGDEFALDGRYAEDARRPVPWDDPPPAAERSQSLYRSLLALRREHPALREGGLRLLHADADSVTFLREASGERVLVRAARARVDAVTVPVRGPAVGVRGAADLLAASGPLALPPTDGAGLQVWQLEAERR
jgi:alpha-glucosidase